MPDAELSAIEARIREFEARTGVEAVAVVVDCSDRDSGLCWRWWHVGQPVERIR